MSEVQQPLTLQFNGAGNQSMTTAEGEALTAEDNVVLAVIITPQAGPPVPIAPDGSPLSLDVSVQRPYDQTTSPGVVRVG